VAPEAAPGGDPFFGSALALTTLTLVAAVSMGRLFADGSFLVPLVAAAVVAHASAWYARRIGLGLGLGLLLSAFAVGLAVTWVVLPHTTAYGIPWRGTWHAANTELSTSWSQFSQVVAPAPVTKGFLIAAMWGVGVTAMLADWAAYRVRTTFEPLLPPFTLFLFASALGASRQRALATGAFVAAVLLFLVVHQAALRADSTAWFASRSRGGVGTLLHGASAIGLVAVVAAVAIGPNLPGAQSKPLISWRKSGDAGNRDRVTTSPLVDIRGRLVTQSDIEVFTVRSTARAYWQLTTLDTFDGRIWSSNRTYTSVRRSLPGGIDDSVKQNKVVQDFAITGLDSIWLPVAYRPERIEGVDNVSYNAELGSLISKESTSDGLTYKVESQVPEFRPEALKAAPAVSPDERFLALPPLPTSVVREAQRVTAAGATAYDKALALQNYFRTGFTYSLQVRPGHDDNALQRFLFRDKKGYCEQFAGAYAAMARAVGLPSRVAVGFTPGEVDNDGLFHVRGLNAHAWPEVYFERYGWVAFEPTPGRGRPGAEAYTGAAESQANPANTSVATTALPTTTTTAAPGGTTATTRNRDEQVDSGGGGVVAPKKANPVLRGLLVLAGLVALWCIGVPVALGRRRARRRAAASSGAGRPGGGGVGRVLVSWEEASEALARAGAPRRSAETVHEYAARAPGAVGIGGTAGEAMTALAAQTAVASYSGGALPAEAVARSMAAAAVVESAVQQQAGWRQRLLWRLDPRPLVPNRTREITGKAGSKRVSRQSA
jgi:transglutaminase-like putative cysteine protease